MNKTLVVLVVMAAIYVAGSIKKMIDDAASYNALQENLEQLSERVEAQGRDMEQLNAMLREDSLVIDSLRAERARLDAAMAGLRADSLRMGRRLTEARAARYQADSTLAALRHATDETLLDPEAYKLVLAERAAGDRAREEANACDTALENCEKRGMNLAGQIGTLQVESQTLQKDLDSTKVELLDWQSLSSSQDSTITDLNDRLKPSFWKSLRSPSFLYGAAAGGALAALIALLVGN